jgi:Icc-related predicted phosphoesterase
VRIYFVSDIHGSEVCFRKLLNSVPVYQPDVMIIGGDITGKVTVPIVCGDGSARALTTHGEEALADEVAIAAFERRIADGGSYTWRCSMEEYEQARADPDGIDQVFERVVAERVEAWMRLAAERLADSPVRLYVSGGNDDFWSIDEILHRAERVECPDRQVVSLDEGVQMLSFGAANRTPWNCPRDLEEDELASVIDELAEQLDGDATAIFNLHVPPYGTELDAGPLLDGQQRLKLGMNGPERASVGSTAVREAILRHRPALSLHGHVHESRAVVKLGETIAINPGSEYNQGVLRGALIDMKRGRVKRHQLVCG